MLWFGGLPMCLSFYISIRSSLKSAVFQAFNLKEEEKVSWTAVHDWLRCRVDHRLSIPPPLTESDAELAAAINHERWWSWYTQQDMARLAMGRCVCFIQISD